MMAAITMSLLTVPSVAPGAVLFVQLPAEDVVPEFALPADSRYFAMDLADMRGYLSAAPMESFSSPVPGLTVALPLPDHRSEEFSVWEDEQEWGDA